MNKKDLFSDHTEWSMGKYSAINKKTGVTLWTANGASFFTSNNGTIEFGLVERHFLWRHFQKMCLRKALGYEK